MKTASLLVALGALGACDPIWSVHMKLRDPANQPVETATLAVACADEHSYPPAALGVRSNASGEANVGGLGFDFPVGCDIYVAKPGFRTQRIRYSELCPDGPHGCTRAFSFDLVLEPE